LLDEITINGTHYVNGEWEFGQRALLETLLHEQIHLKQQNFGADPIKPGRVTLARLSRARNETKLMMAGAEVIRAPMAFTGCSGTVRFDRPAEEVGRVIMEEGLEHHFALAYGDHKPALRAIAARWNLPVLELA
jgi:L-fucose isomerase-like protein